MEPSNQAFCAKIASEGEMPSPLVGPAYAHPGVHEVFVEELTDQINSAVAPQLFELTAGRSPYFSSMPIVKLMLGTFFSPGDLDQTVITLFTVDESPALQAAHAFGHQPVDPSGL